MPKGRDDPRTYIRREAPPILSQKGIKIQARSAEVYNPTFPTRQNVREENYNRRIRQLTQQGFRSVNYKPYQNIGGEIYLSNKRLILTALGQWNESDDEDSSSEEEEDSEEEGQQTQSLRPMTPAKFVLRRTRKDLNNLHKEVAHGRNLIRNVKLGHGLFEKLRYEQEMKLQEEEMENRKQRQFGLLNWNPDDSSSDGETDEELGEDVELTGFMSQEGGEGNVSPEPSLPAPSPVTRSRVSFAGHPSPRSARTGAKSAASKKSSKTLPPRPYTATHTNIFNDGPTTLTTHSKEALFRQLCALNWILDAMNIDTNYAMENINTCWNLNTIGGAKIHIKKLERKDRIESEYSSFVATKTPTKARRLLRGSNPRRKTSSTVISSHFPPRSRESNSAASGSPKGSETQLNSARNEGQHLDTEAPFTPPIEEEEEPADTKGIFSFLDDYYESLSKEKAEREKAEQGNSGDPPPPPPSQPEKKKKKKDKKRSSEGESGVKSPRKTSKKAEHASGEENKIADSIYERTMSARTLRANAVHLLRPKSSPALLELQANLPSNRWSHMATDMKLKFAETAEEKALELHEKLEQIEKQKYATCQQKFLAIPFSKNTVHDALKQMKEALADKDAKRAERLKQKPIHCQWYSDLLTTVDSLDLSPKDRMYFRKIMDKLEKYGKIDSGKQTVLHFLKILERLRDWEICNPDVSAAIEFCRERIVEMTVEDFEEWFRQYFPAMKRPQTAPPVLNLERGKKGEK
ncbi:coiled-coil domain-containing protein 60 isoform X2 [Lingula anatina]|uniref:Coiled-coil domain-containing protein 60 isoform X2 n=1 Tax=Lingula anatina TaxID=7574 RepID=A0A1S3GY42_LINAN|nr:coiled-coil domain-containing protein 60 isoform X2 [Lingula anatina]|eukprot:XP_013378790.1 coiled-coil domain-containing protein 60 isoform X2 [Lingula anatina]